MNTWNMTMSDSNRHNFSEEAIKVYDVEGELFLVGQNAKFN